jgi:hypothetical protein
MELSVFVQVLSDSMTNSSDPTITNGKASD